MSDSNTSNEEERSLILLLVITKGFNKAKITSSSEVIFFAFSSKYPIAA